MPFRQREWSRIFYPFYPRSRQRSVSSAFHFFSEREYHGCLSGNANDRGFFIRFIRVRAAIRFIRVQVFFRTLILRQAQHEYHGCPSGNANGRGFFIQGSAYPVSFSWNSQTPSFETPVSSQSSATDPLQYVCCAGNSATATRFPPQDIHWL
jgi:hypothetical protein